MFQITELAEVFMLGYIRLFSESNQHVPQGIQHDIIKYVNLCFVRLNYHINGDDTMLKQTVCVINDNFETVR